MDEEAEQGLFQRCNLCWSPVNEIYKTACNHCFCVNCAEAHFSKDRCCPVCGIQLSQKHFSGPLEIGLSTGDAPTAAIFKTTFQQSNRLEDIITSSLACLPALEDVISFVMTQLFLEIQRTDAAKFRAEKKLRKAKNDLKNVQQEGRAEIARLTQHAKESDAKLRRKFEEVDNMRNEVHDSHRKLKTYENMLVRLHSEGHNIPHMPLSTPPALTMSAASAGGLSPRDPGRGLSGMSTLGVGGGGSFVPMSGPSPSNRRQSTYSTGPGTPQSTGRGFVPSSTSASLANRLSPGNRAAHLPHNTFARPGARGGSHSPYGPQGGYH